MIRAIRWDHIVDTMVEARPLLRGLFPCCEVSFLSAELQPIMLTIDNTTGVRGLGGEREAISMSNPNPKPKLLAPSSTLTTRVEKFAGSPCPLGPAHLACKVSKLPPFTHREHSSLRSLTHASCHYFIPSTVSRKTCSSSATD